MISQKRRSDKPAPPALASYAYSALLPGEADIAAPGLFGYALFIALVLLLTRRLCLAPFAPGYRAFGFPVASLRAAARRIAHATTVDAARYLALAPFLVANAAVPMPGLLPVAALAGAMIPAALTTPPRRWDASHRRRMTAWVARRQKIVIMDNQSFLRRLAAAGGPQK